MSHLLLACGVVVTPAHVTQARPVDVLELLTNVKLMTLHDATAGGVCTAAAAEAAPLSVTALAQETAARKLPVG